MASHTPPVVGGSGSHDVVGRIQSTDTAAAVATPAETTTRWRTDRVSTTSTDRHVKGIRQAITFKGARLLPHAAAAATFSYLALTSRLIGAPQ